MKTEIGEQELNFVTVHWKQDGPND